MRPELQAARQKAEQEGSSLGLPIWLGIPLGLVIVPLAILVKLVVSPFEKPVKRTPIEVEAILGAYLDRKVSNSAWDEFICVPIADPRLESMRKYCLDLPWVPIRPDDAWLSPENERVIRGYLAELEGAA